ncbi:MAG: hypothetical protein ACRDN6_00145 [Gaiellaceae bacterium]
MTDWPERAARNESLFREVNDRIKAIDAALGSEEGRFVCECRRIDCADTIEIRLDDYVAVRAHGDRFAVVTGHEDPGIERVVESHARFTVVEKLGEAGMVAEELDPRS